ncbi:serine O-acetyltransferase [Chondrinema litorale]|uniref:serine O-acetyltransferase n=1 Tax=Chondrinema litorale TaxID=2994555 RepID=UPI002542E41B|nr:serine acetyltransferase [Chondrinema litorale]UZR98609.1 serine acetyltransferase [Chondrinema litorale]
MNKPFINKIYLSHQDCVGCPSPEMVQDFFVDLLGTLFSDYSKMQFNSIKEFELHIEKLKLQLDQILYRSPGESDISTEALVEEFFEQIPVIHKKLEQDVQAMFEGDPAAKSTSEVIRTYPGFYTIAAYRFAHVLHKLGVKIIPRIITEHAHSKTGIDIHPAAVIGDYFCIDHGTGIVIGETTKIGNYVKIYQGVTLGALSVNKEDAEKKRHPTISDNVIIYAGATILGGETVIGHDCIIGGNVWITKSLPPHTKIYYQAKMSNGDTGETDIVIYKNKFNETI